MASWTKVYMYIRFFCNLTLSACFNWVGASPPAPQHTANELGNIFQWCTSWFPHSPRLKNLENSYTPSPHIFPLEVCLSLELCLCSMWVEFNENKKGGTPYWKIAQDAKRAHLEPIQQNWSIVIICIYKWTRNNHQLRKGLVPSSLFSRDSAYSNLDPLLLHHYCQAQLQLQLQLSWKLR